MSRLTENICLDLHHVLVGLRVAECLLEEPWAEDRFLVELQVGEHLLGLGENSLEEPRVGVPSLVGLRVGVPSLEGLSVGLHPLGRLSVGLPPLVGLRVGLRLLGGLRV